MDGKIKIAICFSGQLRCHWKITEFWVRNFFNSFDKNIYDLYIFFYSNLQYSNTLDSILKDYSEYKIITFFENDLDFSKKLDFIFNLPTGGLERGGHNQLLREFNSMDKVIDMKKKYEKDNNFIFNYVFRTRYDVIPLKIFDIRDLKNDKFYLSNHCHHSGLNARFTLSSSEESNRVYTIIEKSIDVHQKTNKFSGELYWKHHLEHLNTEIGLLDFQVGLVRDYDNNLPRHEHGCISLNGVGVKWFELTEGKINYFI